MSLSKNKKLDILNTAINILKQTSISMHSALHNAIFIKKPLYQGNAYTIESIFPEFTKNNYHKYHENIDFNSIKTTFQYWDKCNKNGNLRRIKFLEYLKTTV